MHVEDRGETFIAAHTFQGFLLKIIRQKGHGQLFFTILEVGRFVTLIWLMIWVGQFIVRTSLYDLHGFIDCDSAADSFCRTAKKKEITKTDLRFSTDH